MAISTDVLDAAKTLLLERMRSEEEAEEQNRVTERLARLEERQMVMEEMMLQLLEQTKRQ